MRNIVFCARAAVLICPLIVAWALFLGLYYLLFGKAAVKDLAIAVKEHVS